MENKNIYSLRLDLTYKELSFFILLLILPNLLSMINISTYFGWKIHFFQFAVILAAMKFGPIGGLSSAIIGSAYSAISMNNPYIIIGNAILGFFTGLLFRKKFKIVYAVLIAYLIQLPWLIITDYYLVNLPIIFILTLVPSLLISNVLWAIAANYTSKFIK